MKQTIEIEVPDGKKAVWKDNNIIFENIEFELPKTWRDFCEQNRGFNIKHTTMNENIDLTKILKDCPKGTTFYHLVYEDVSFEGITDLVYPIQVSSKEAGVVLLSRKGRMAIGKGECVLFPSKDQRDWTKFTAPWLKKERFDPKTLEPFDRVLVKYEDNDWLCSFFSKHKDVINSYPICACVYCIPYNDDTKHLVGTSDEAPEFYRYWED